MRQAEIDPHQNSGAGGFLRGVVQAVSLRKVRHKKRAETALFAEHSSSDFWRTASSVGWIEVHSAARHDGRDGVFVDHLRHSVAQQYNVLIKRFDLALELDAVDQVDGHGHMLAAKDIEKWILQQLAFVL